jgi:hypothetical protein
MPQFYRITGFPSSRIPGYLEFPAMRAILGGMNAMTWGTDLMVKAKKAEPALDEARKVTAVFTEAQRRKMREYAAREGTTLQQVIVQSVTEFLAKKGVKL